MPYARAALMMGCPHTERSVVSIAQVDVLVMVNMLPQAAKDI